MMHAILSDCWPWAALLAAAIVAARWLAALSGAKLSLRRMAGFHNCEEGSVQSLSFVLTLPVFIMVLMLIVQVSQVMIGTVLVHYAAFASARSAIVWIPSNVGGDETENRISAIAPAAATEHDQRNWTSNYQVHSDGPKYAKIKNAAVLACLPLAPSRELGYGLSPAQRETVQALATVYSGLDREATANSRIPQRLSRKLAYTEANTDVVVTFKHTIGPPGQEPDPPLGIRYDLPHDMGEFYWNQLGWRDPITVEVTHYMALLPGPGRLLARSTGSRDEVSQGVDRRGNVYVWPISATATLGNEGQIPVRSYRQEESR